MADPKRIAAIVTEYRPKSHADVILTKYLRGFPTDEGLISPRSQIVSLYVDQFPENDLSREYAAQHGVPIYGSIPQALTLDGDKLAVDGVLIIGEHGDYAWNEKEQHLYPRKHFMEQVCGIMATSGRSVPVFSDKHLSYNWQDAMWMFERTRSLGAPFMAGSSLPTCWRSPWLEHPLNTPIESALSIGYGGIDSYGFHALETLQCMVERRPGGESGVAAVTCLEGDAVWQAADRLWPLALAEAAVGATPYELGRPLAEKCDNPALLWVEYRDGLQAGVLMLNGFGGDFQTFGYAARVAGQIQACEFYLCPSPTHAHFSYLSLNIEEMFITGQPTYPVERTLLTTGTLEALLDSRYQGHVRLETPHLHVAYQPAADVPWRARRARPVGASLGETD